MVLRPVNTANLEQLLTKIWSGELEHRQDTFFCGTTCCVAGWDVALNHPVDYDNYIKGVGSAYDLIEAIADPFEWSMLNNNLNFSEAVLMFNANTTKYLQQKILEAFQEGRRLGTLDWGVRVWDQDWQSDHYSSGVVQILTSCKEDYHVLIEFLGDFDDTLVQVWLIEKKPLTF